MAADGNIRVRNLALHFRVRDGVVQAVDDVSFDLQRGRTMVVLGESGCGKTSLSKAIIRLLPNNVQRYSGTVAIGDDDLMSYDDEEFRTSVRWLRMALVPQAAMNSLNPVIRVADQVAEPLIEHGVVGSHREALDRARKIFELVGLSADFLNRYPFELSGGMRQRVVLAMSLVTSPELVVLDEPTSALDILTQANILNVLKSIKREFDTTFVLITHDVATSSELADDVAVMYAGQLVEKSDAEHFFNEPLHPYSQLLMASVPTLRETKDLQFIPGQPPSLLDPPRGCRFADRCPKRFDRCSQEPPLISTDDGRQVKCWLYESASGTGADAGIGEAEVAAEGGRLG